MALTRTLKYTPPGGKKPRNITVSVGIPEPDPLPGGDFRVLVTITGFDEPYSKHVCGVDGIQAMLYAFALVPVLVTSFAGKGGRVTWLGSEDLRFHVEPDPPA